MMECMAEGMTWHVRWLTPKQQTTRNATTQVLRLRFVPEGEDDEDVDIDFLKSVEEQIRTKLKVRCGCVGWVWG